MLQNIEILSVFISMTDLLFSRFLIDHLASSEYPGQFGQSQMCFRFILIKHKRDFGDFMELCGCSIRYRNKGQHVMNRRILGREN